MENILIFLCTVMLYGGAFCVFAPLGRPKKWAFSIALISLLSLPININGNVFTVIGNAKSEKSVYSVFSLYQHAGEDAVTIFSLAGYQKTGRNALTFVGVSVGQTADG